MATNYAPPIMLFIFGRLSKANEIIKLTLIENAKYGAATDSSRKGQKFFCKNFFFCKKLFYNHL